MLCRKLVIPARAFVRSIYTMEASSVFCQKGTFSSFNKNGGEDALVNNTWIFPGALQGTCILGVADGVSGWKQHGTDPARLSNELCRQLGVYFERAETSERVPKPQELLSDAFSKIESYGDSFAGGTTVCMGIFDPISATLSTCNVGDSGIMVVRRGRIVFATYREVLRNVPRQLVIVPSSMLDGQHKKRSFGTDVNDATLDSVTLEHGDVVVCGTDGLFDNVFNSTVLNSVTQFMLESECWSKTNGELVATSNIAGAAEIAEKLLKQAYYNSLDPNFASPYATNSFNEGHILPGGKPDDITVTVGLVFCHTELSDEPQQSCSHA